jgi:hypothetical protein
MTLSVRLISYDDDDHYCSTLEGFLYFSIISLLLRTFTPSSGVHSSFFSSTPVSLLLLLFLLFATFSYRFGSYRYSCRLGRSSDRGRSRGFRGGSGWRRGREVGSGWALNFGGWIYIHFLRLGSASVGNDWSFDRGLRLGGLGERRSGSFGLDLFDIFCRYSGGGRFDHWSRGFWSRLFRFRHDDIFCLSSWGGYWFHGRSSVRCLCFFGRLV